MPAERRTPGRPLELALQRWMHTTSTFIRKVKKRIFSDAVASHLSKTRHVSSNSVKHCDLEILNVTFLRMIISGILLGENCEKFKSQKFCLPICCD